MMVCVLGKWIPFNTYMLSRGTCLFTLQQFIHTHICKHVIHRHTHAHRYTALTVNISKGWREYFSHTQQRKLLLTQRERGNSTLVPSLERNPPLQGRAREFILLPSIPQVILKPTQSQIIPRGGGPHSCFLSRGQKIEVWLFYYEQVKEKHNS